MKHVLKTLPEYFQPSWVGVKTFEIRKNDRDFKLYDKVVLIETTLKGDRTGRSLEGHIEYLTDYEQKSGYIVFSLFVTIKTEERE